MFPAPLFLSFVYTPVVSVGGSYGFFLPYPMLEGIFLGLVFFAECDFVSLFDHQLMVL